jgi:hypothetical protein
MVLENNNYSFASRILEALPVLLIFLPLSFKKIHVMHPKIILDFKVERYTYSFGLFGLTELSFQCYHTLPILPITMNKELRLHKPYR